MKNIAIQIEISSALYSKNPDSSELGRKIVSQGIVMIHEMGLEGFTFKKLGKAIGSTESSIYRYFDSKHTLLLYLTSWYWTWIEYRLVFATSNVVCAAERLERSIEILTQPVTVDNSISYVNEVLLSEIIFSESTKAYQTKNVDEENNRGSFTAYKRVVKKVGELVLELKPQFAYPRMLISTIIEGAHHQKYFAEHLPALTDLDTEENSITQFYLQLVKHFTQ
ncbi:MAG: TetR/AcrR family transcriptional regulator [Colwellia sp.]|nr:TetR/AcrR family transcriptional regulator [Colwellia sp.]